MARVVVAGYAIRHPLGGNLIAFVHHVLGFHLLGHEVFYVEESGWPESCYDPVKQEYGNDPSEGLDVIQCLMDAHGFRVPLCYVSRQSGETFGTDDDTLRDALRGADLLLNVGGVCWLPEFELSRCRAVVDKDPFFTQVGLFGGSIADRHHVHFSYGVNIGRPGCSIPTGGIQWLPTVPPVITDLWARTSRSASAPFTTIGSLNAIATVSYNGEEYGQKDVEFLKIIELPKHTPQPLELALKDNLEVMERLQAGGWRIRDAGEVSTNPDAYRRYICSSRGEFSVAKNGYVKTHSGWFSDRSVCYIAAGLPVVVQDTGIGDWLPTGTGVVPFSTLQEAVDGLERVNSTYLEHCEAARRLAETIFDYRVVLPRLLDVAL